MDENAPCCGTCKAYSALTKECRRKAPGVWVIVVQKGPITLGVFPAADERGWCMEYLAPAPSLARIN